MQPELPVDVPKVEFHRLRTEKQGSGDFLIARPINNPERDDQLVWGQLVGRQRRILGSNRARRRELASGPRRPR